MFDIFATILSAGVVISVVTLVVHEPMLLAAGISIILGLMFVLLPVFVAMVPVLGYLLVLIGIISLGYGMLSARSWLNTLHARRAAALARKRAAYANRDKDSDDSALERASQLASVAGPSALAAAPYGDDEEPPLRRPASYGSYRDASLDEASDRTAGGRGTSGLARLGRGLGRDAADRAADRATLQEIRETRESRPERGVASGRNWRNPFEHDDEPEVLPSPMPPKQQSQPVVPPKPVPAAHAPTVQAPTVQAPAAQAVSRPARPPKILSRGAERIQRIKAESRENGFLRRSRPGAGASKAAVVAKGPSSESPLQPVGVAPAPASVAGSPQLRRRERDLLELDLLDFDPEGTSGRDEGAAKAGSKGRNGKGNGDGPAPAKPFVSRLARRR